MLDMGANKGEINISYGQGILRADLELKVIREQTKGAIYPVPGVCAASSGCEMEPVVDRGISLDNVGQPLDERQPVAGQAWTRVLFSPEENDCAAEM